MLFFNHLFLFGVQEKIIIVLSKRINTVVYFHYVHLTQLLTRLLNIKVMSVILI